MDIAKEDLIAYFKAREIDNCNRNSTRMSAFKLEHAQVYQYLNSFYRLRTELFKDIEILRLIGQCYWFTLTFNQDRDKSLTTTKRKQATRFLNDLFIAYEMVEEYGSSKGRYHIHGFGVFRENKGFEDFRKWPSRQKIETLPYKSLKDKARYLTKYAVKDLPRRRRSKTLVYLSKSYNKNKGLRLNGFESCFNCAFNNALLKVQFGVYNRVSKRPQ